MPRLGGWAMVHVGGGATAREATGSLYNLAEAKEIAALSSASKMYGISVNEFVRCAY